MTDNRTTESKPLFIPLYTQHFEAFERGEKRQEYRPHGPRWNELTCYAGRRVTISCGYGKHRRLHGVVSSASLCDATTAFTAIYGDKAHCFAISIQLEAQG